MKTIGKIAVLGMTLSLAFVLSACGGSASSSAASSSAAASSASASASAASASAASASAASASAASASAASASAASTATTYTNAAFGLDYYLPAGWTFSDAATLQQMNSPVASAASSSAIDMVAVAADAKTAVIVALVEPGMAGTAKTAEEFLQAQVDAMTQSLAGSNYAYTSTSADITFNGMARTLPANIMNITADGNSLVIGQAVAEKDGYFLDVIVTGATEDDVTNAFKAFTATAE